MIPQTKIRILACVSLWLLTSAVECLAAKKDFRGLFGSYRREKYVENEGNSTDFGVDLMLSTMLPITTIVESDEKPSDPNITPAPLAYSTFFNLETAFFVTLGYHWEVFLNLGYYTFETRKENTKFTKPEQPLFHQFEVTMFPAMLGLKYRLSTSDIVPYIGAGAGMAYIQRKGYYDYNENIFDLTHMNRLVAQVVVGLEFFISSRAGIRLEASGYYINTQEETWGPGGDSFPAFVYKASPLSLRYSSGLFLLF